MPVDGSLRRHAVDEPGNVLTSTFSELKVEKDVCDRVADILKYNFITMSLAGLFQDALFAAIAAIGFACISKPPSRAYRCCALIAAIGHSIRYMLVEAPGLEIHIVPATLVAATAVGVLAVFLSPYVKCPAETCLFPSLLPMIPGIYAYRSVAGLAMCVLHDNADDFDRYYTLFAHNGLTCMCILLVMVVGATIPVFMFKRVSFSATR